MFEIRIDWLDDTRGIITSNEVKDTVHVAIPPAFGGTEDQWSPEHLFLGSIASCFMTTYLVLSRKMRFDISRLECQAIGHIERVEGVGYTFVSIDLYPKISVGDENLRSKALAALQKTKQHCLVSNAVRARIVYHPELIVQTNDGHQQGMEITTVIPAGLPAVQ